MNEDLNGDIAKLRADISMIDSTIATRTNPLMQQKVRLQKMLAMKEKQAQDEAKKNPQQQQQQPGQQQMAAQGTQMSTPGSAGASTPGQ
jgi:hypothetical protein